MPVSLSTEVPSREAAGRFLSGGPPGCHVLAGTGTRNVPEWCSPLGRHCMRCSALTAGFGSACVPSPAPGPPAPSPVCIGAGTAVGTPSPGTAVHSGSRFDSTREEETRYYHLRVIILLNKRRKLSECETASSCMLAASKPVLALSLHHLLLPDR